MGEVIFVPHLIVEISQEERGISHKWKFFDGINQPKDHEMILLLARVKVDSDSGFLLVA